MDLRLRWPCCGGMFPLFASQLFKHYVSTDKKLTRHQGNSVSTGNRRFLEIDIFRGIAALWVVYYHFLFRYRTMFDSVDIPAGWFYIPGMPEKYIGLLPVYLFFIISGFVIIWTLERCQDWRDFVVSRFSRLFPTYWTALAVTATVGILAPLPKQNYDALQVVVNATMIQEIFGVEHIDGVYWSLMVELLFYAYAISLFAVGLLPRVQIVCLVLAGLCAVNHALALVGIDIWWKVQKYGLLIYGHYFAAGISFFQIWVGRGNKMTISVLGLCLLSIFLAVPLAPAIAITGFFFIFGLAVGGHLRWLVNRPLVWLGGISYPLYVCHQMLGYRLIILARKAGASHEIAALLALICVLALANLISSMVEKPAMRVIRTGWQQMARSMAS